MSDLDLLDHSPFGPSAASIWINCTGSIRAQAGLPDTESVFAAEGTAAHLLSEWARNENVSSRKWLGTKIEFPKRLGNDELWSFEVTEEMVDAVDEFIDLCNEFPPPGEKVSTAKFEMRVHYDRFVKDGFGTADDIRVWAGTCVVTDLKFGKGLPIASMDNTQLKMYALGVYEELNFAYDIENFILQISQPRIDNTSRWGISTTDLLEWAETVVAPAAIEAMGDSPKLKAGEHCRWCRARFLCKARAAHTLNLIGFDQMDVTKDRILLDPMEIAELLPHLPGLKKWADDIEAKALELVQSRQKVGDWKLVAGRRSRDWDDEKAVDKALSRAGLKASERYKPRKLISPPEVEKKLGKDHVLLKSPEEKGGHVTWSPGSPKLAPGSDPRPSVITDIEFPDLTNDTEFKDISNEE